MLHAYMLVQSGIPVIYSGDEVGQLNDYTYHEDLKKKEDSRYLHRGNFLWDLAQKRKEKDSVQQKLFDGIGKLEKIRSQYSVFEVGADVWTLNTGDTSILGIVRSHQKEKLIALFNFSEFDKTAFIYQNDGIYTDLISGAEMQANEIKVPKYGVYWLLKKD